MKAQFDAARAALLSSGAPVEPEIAKTHNGLISAFSLHLVKTGRVSVELGKALNSAEAKAMIEHAAALMGTTVSRFFGRATGIMTYCARSKRQDTNLYGNSPLRYSAASAERGCRKNSLAGVRSVMRP